MSTQICFIDKLGSLFILKIEATTPIFHFIKQQNDGNLFTTCFIKSNKGVKYTYLLNTLVRICFYLEKVSIPIYCFKTKWKSQMKENVKKSFYCVVTLLQASRHWYSWILSFRYQSYGQKLKHGIGGKFFTTCFIIS